MCSCKKKLHVLTRIDWHLAWLTYHCQRAYVARVWRFFFLHCHDWQKNNTEQKLYWKYCYLASPIINSLCTNVWIGSSFKETSWRQIFQYVTQLFRQATHGVVGQLRRPLSHRENPTTSCTGAFAAFNDRHSLELWHGNCFNFHGTTRRCHQPAVLGFSSTQCGQCWRPSSTFSTWPTLPAPRSYKPWFGLPYLVLEGPFFLMGRCRSVSFRSELPFPPQTWTENATKTYSSPPPLIPW